MKIIIIIITAEGFQETYNDKRIAFRNSNGFQGPWIYCVRQTPNVVLSRIVQTTTRCPYKAEGQEHFFPFQEETNALPHQLNIYICLWTLSVEMEKRIHSLEIRCYRKIQNISYRCYISDEEVAVEIV